MQISSFNKNIPAITSIFFLKKEMEGITVKNIIFNTKIFSFEQSLFILPSHAKISVVFKILIGEERRRRKKRCESPLHLKITSLYESIVL